VRHDGIHWQGQHKAVWLVRVNPPAFFCGAPEISCRQGITSCSKSLNGPTLRTPSSPSPSCAGPPLVVCRPSCHLLRWDPDLVCLI
jgi:hypothetical protein